MRQKSQGTDMKKQIEDENCPESDWEAVAEAVLFTMGGSVELGQLAVAIGQSMKTRTGECRSLNWRMRTKCAPEPGFMRI